MIKINSTKFGEVTINGRTYYSDVIVFWDGRIEYVEKDYFIDVDDVMKILENKINILIIGTGQDGSVRVSEKLRELAEDMKIKMFELKTPDAIELFNGFASQNRRVVAIIHTN